MIVDALATYRLVRLAQEDSLFEPARERFLARARTSLWPKVSELAWCPWCLSVWVAAGVVAARRFAPRAWSPAASVLALSAVTGLLSEAAHMMEGD